MPFEDIRMMGARMESAVEWTGVLLYVCKLHSQPTTTAKAAETADFYLDPHSCAGIAGRLTGGGERAQAAR